MEHRGEILKEVLKELGIQKKGLAKKLSRHPNTITNYLSQPDLPDALMLEIGAAINYDFSPKIPTLKRILDAANQAAVVSEPSSAYMKALPTQAPASLPACQQELLDMYRRYTELQTQHIKVLSKLARVA